MNCVIILFFVTLYNVLLLESLDESACVVERLSVQIIMILLLTTVLFQCDCDFSYCCDLGLEDRARVRQLKR